MREVQATEAKAHLAQLLTLVEGGETIVITRHGKTIAHIVPAELHSREAKRQKVQAFLTQRKRWSKTGVSAHEAMQWRHEGHQH